MAKYFHISVRPGLSQSIISVGSYLGRDIRGRKIAAQLISNAGSISAIIEEGYGRGFGKDYARFLKVSLGSARECRDWYYRGRRLLSENVLKHRYQHLNEIIGLLVTHIHKQRNYK